jgi:starvation-inducible DNA-binding protein
MQITPGMTSVSDCLADCLSNAVVIYYRAKGHHWNVVGNDFSQFHAFFEEIAEDVESSIDPLAENMRKLGAFSPYRLSEFAKLSSIQDTMVGTNAMSMCKDLYDSNDVMLTSLDQCFVAATEANEQGVADFIAGRIDMHKKWRWQLNAFLSSESVPVEEELIQEPAQELVQDFALVICEVCKDDICACPASYGSACTCAQDCPCQLCHK